jgi:hypothetical protein
LRVDEQFLPVAGALASNCRSPAFMVGPRRTSPLRTRRVDAGPSEFDVECPGQEGNAREAIDVEEGTVTPIEAPHVAKEIMSL